MEKRTLILLGVFLVVASGALTYWFGPKRVKIVEKEVIKTVTDTVVKRDVVTIIETKPDGTTKETIIDKSVEEELEVKEEKKEKIVEKKPVNLNWTVSAGSMITEREFYISVDRRILGNISIGVLGTSTGTVGVHASVRF